MDSIHIYGGSPLYGELELQGSKNAVLPILAATVLIEGTVQLEHCPEIADVRCMLGLLESIGCRVCREKERLVVDAGQITAERLPREQVRRMRSSVILMGALLGRRGRVEIAYPGGCVIGRRPIDMHMDALKRLGVLLCEEQDKLTAWSEGLHGGEIELPFPSVGATENSILAAVLAEGETVIRGAAKEPEIGALCEFLHLAGADISRQEQGAVLRIRGVKKLHSCSYKIPADRIVAGTYLLACMATGGSISLLGLDGGELAATLAVMEQMGGRCSYEKKRITVEAPERPKPVPYLKTAVYPGYPTDLQSQLLAVLSLADGESVVEEDIFENRFRTVPELVRMGADIRIEGNCAYIKGVKRLHGAEVTAQELRGGAALCLAALSAEGETRIANRHFIDRGYEALEADFRRLGGRI